jgi:phosphopantothenate-cysteine ligase
LQSEHKIQSGKGSLHIEMDQVPKVLKPMVEEWTRDGYIVSFKVRYSFFFSIPLFMHSTVLSKFPL